MENPKSTEAKGQPAAEAKEAGTAEGSKTRREKRASLDELLLKKVCPYCATKGAWRVVGEKGPKRYIKCVGCGTRQGIAGPAADSGATPGTSGRPAKVEGEP